MVQARISTALICLVAALALPAAAQAAPTWLAPVTISEPDQNVGLTVGPQVALDPQGNSLAVWPRDSIRSAFRPVGADFGPALNSSGPSASAAQVAFDSQGNAIAVWRRSTGGNFRVQAAYRPAGGSFGGAQTLSEAGQHADSPQVAFDSQGNAIAVWQRFDEDGDGRVQAAYRPAGASAVFGPAQTISAEGEDARVPQIAVNPAGNAIAIWQRIDPAPNGIIYAVRPPGPGSSFASPQPLTTALLANNPQVAMDSQGNALAIWNATVDGFLQIRAAFRSAGAPFFAAAQTLTAGTQNPTRPQVAFDPQGNAVAVWEEGITIRTAFRPAGGSFGASVTISSPASSPGRPQVAVDPQGNALAVWENSGGTGERIDAAFRPAATSFGAPQTISDTGQARRNPQVAIDPQGNGIAVWVRSDIGVSRVDAAGFDAAGPELQGLQIPVTGTAGVPLAFSVSPFDAWSPVASVTWSFGDGAAAAGAQASHAYANPGTYQVSVTATDAVGNSATAQSTVQIAPAPAGPPTADPPQATRPGLARLQLAPRGFRAAPRGPSVSRPNRRAPIGGRVRYLLSEPARVLFVVHRAAPGRRAGGQCRRPTANNSARPRCVRLIRARGSFAHRGRQGPNTLHFRGRVGGRQLPPGRYLLSARAINHTGNPSVPRRATFRIVR